MIETENTTTPAPDATEARPLRLAWGYPLPEGITPRIAWGARAIYKLQHSPTRVARKGGRRRGEARTEAIIDLLWDRQGTVAAPDVTERESKAFATWLNTKALPALKRACVKQYVTADCGDVVSLTLDGYALIASPRASYGYLYIVAWKA